MKRNYLVMIAGYPILAYACYCYHAILNGLLDHWKLLAVFKYATWHVVKDTY